MKKYRTPIVNELAIKSEKLLASSLPEQFDMTFQKQQSSEDALIRQRSTTIFDDGMSNSE